jgi:hypothetical protein
MTEEERRPVEPPPHPDPTAHPVPAEEAPGAASRVPIDAPTVVPPADMPPERPDVDAPGEDGDPGRAIGAGHVSDPASDPPATSAGSATPSGEEA